MKKLLLIPSLALSTLAPMVATTSCNKPSSTDGIVWDRDDKGSERWNLYSKKLKTTAWSFIDEGSYVKCEESEKERISLYVLKSDIFTGSPVTLYQDFSIQINGKKIKYNWVFHLASNWDDCTSDLPVEVK